jgi:hypothetical protein
MASNGVRAQVSAMASKTRREKWRVTGVGHAGRQAAGGEPRLASGAPRHEVKRHRLADALERGLRRLTLRLGPGERMAVDLVLARERRQRVIGLDAAAAVERIRDRFGDDQDAHGAAGEADQNRSRPPK